MTKKVSVNLIVFLLLSFSVYASPRLKFSINDNWRFYQGDYPNGFCTHTNDSVWQIVNIPHTWNAIDVKDDIPGYYRGYSWYRKSINIPEQFLNKQITMYFEGANQELELYVNEKVVGKHVGGYTRFSFDITQYVEAGQSNTFALRVTNRFNEVIPPLTADFTFFGGVYRDVCLIVTEKQHISTTHYASEGIYISTPTVSDKKARVEVKSMLTNADKSIAEIKLEHTIFSPTMKAVRKIKQKIKLPKNSFNFEHVLSVDIDAPELWSPESPALYSVQTRIFNAKTNELLDEIRQPLGFRWFEFCTQKGFSLNGKPYKLIGTNRHQCFEGLGNALPDEIHVRDVILLKKMGGNFLRVSHYPQDPVVMEMCDKLGIITYVEIPIVNTITEKDEFYKNSLHMAREMVMQDYNRPSLLIWAYMNEVLLRLPFDRKSTQHETYLKSVEKLAQALENQIRKDDPYRYTLIPFHGDFDLYHTAGLSQIPMIVGWNLYQGWYSGTFDGFGKFLDNAQEKLKGKPFIITEYGADVDPRLHSFEPARFDYTQEWANLYHESYYRDIMARSFVVGANIWNLNDFHSERRAYAMPHINNKGIVSLDRKPKDTYLHYQALLSAQPIVNIGGSNWTIRGGIANEEYKCLQPVKVYSNLNELELILNGASLGKVRPVDAIALFDVPFVSGENVLEAVGYSNNIAVRDLLRVDFRMIPANLKDKHLNFESINVMLGSKRHFVENDKSIVWLPEKQYSKGSWGYLGGEPYRKFTRDSFIPASDLNILNTNIDPVFQTMRVGINSFKLDVPDGEYTVSLYFAELMTQNNLQLAYNLGNDPLADIHQGERSFSVNINGRNVLRNLNLAKTYGEQVSVVKKFVITVSSGNGISIDFIEDKNRAILNAIRVYRNY